MSEPVLTVMHQPRSRPPRRVDAVRGDSIVLGSCPCTECGADLVLPAGPGAWFRCLVTAHDDHWRLDNLCIDIEAVVVDLENSDLRISAPPGRRQLVVPFEFSGLSFHVGPHEVSEPVTVIGSEVVVQDPVACRTSLTHVSETELRPGTNYAAVLEELCRDVETTGTLPSSAAVSLRLRERGLRVSPKAVDHHVDYLFRRFFPTADTGSARGYKRWALVSSVMRASATRRTQSPTGQ